MGVGSGGHSSPPGAWAAMPGRRQAHSGGGGASHSEQKVTEMPRCPAAPTWSGRGAAAGVLAHPVPGVQAALTASSGQRCSQPCFLLTGPTAPSRHHETRSCTELPTAVHAIPLQLLAPHKGEGLRHTGICTLQERDGEMRDGEIDERSGDKVRWRDGKQKDR